MDAAVDAGPKVSLSPCEGWRLAVEKGLASVGRRLVVDENVDRAFRRRDEVVESEGLGSLSVLDDPVNTGGVV